MTWQYNKSLYDYCYGEKKDAQAMRTNSEITPSTEEDTPSFNEIMAACCEEHACAEPGYVMSSELCFEDDADMDSCVTEVKTFYRGGHVGMEMLGRVLGSILREYKIPPALVGVVLSSAGVEPEDCDTIINAHINHGNNPFKSLPPRGADQNLLPQAVPAVEL